MSYSSLHAVVAVVRSGVEDVLLVFLSLASSISGVCVLQTVSSSTSSTSPKFVQRQTPQWWCVSNKRSRAIEEDGRTNEQLSPPTALQSTDPPNHVRMTWSGWPTLSHSDVPYASPSRSRRGGKPGFWVLIKTLTFTTFLNDLLWPLFTL